MKQCPQCRRTFQDDSVAFCLYDGQPLEMIGGMAPPPPQGRYPPGYGVPGNYAPRPSKPSAIGWIIGGVVALLVLGRIGLTMLGHGHPTGGGDNQAAVVALIQQADGAEAQADKSLDSSALTQYYAGDALTRVQSDVENLKNQGVYEDGHLESSQVQAVAFDGASKNAAVQVVETWSATIYSSQSNQVVKMIPSQAMPQTIHLQRMGDGWVITRIDFNGTNSATSGTPSGR